MSVEELKEMNDALITLGIDSETPRSELVRRCVNQCSHIQAYAKCLDEFGVPSGVNGARDSGDIARAFREMVQYYQVRQRSLCSLIETLSAFGDHKATCAAVVTPGSPCFCGWINVAQKIRGVKADE